ncbi:MAG: hypothetical protein ACLTXH_02020 [Enterobacter hormaechei]
MVASTVSKLSALLDSQMSDEQAQRLGYETVLRCVKATADAVLLPSGVRLCLAV